MHDSETPVDPLTPMSARQIRARRTGSWALTLPHTDVVVVVRDIHAIDLALNGDIPDTLSRHVWTEATVDGKDQKAVAELLQEQKLVQEITLCAMLVEPRMVMRDDPAASTDDVITIDDINYEDRGFLWRIACGQRSLVDLARFREEPKRVVEVAPVGGGVRAAAVVDPGIAVG